MSELSSPTSIGQRQCNISALSSVGKWVSPLIVLITDYIIIVLALLSAYYFRNALLTNIFDQLPQMYIRSSIIYLYLPLIYIGLLMYERLYTKRLPFWQCAELLFRVCCYATILVAGTLFFLGFAKEMSRSFIVSSGIFAFIYLASARFIIKRLLVKCGLWQKPVIIVGAGKTAELLAQAFNDDPGMGYKIVGVIEDNYHECPLAHRYPLLGDFSSMEQSIASSGVQDIIIATPGLDRQELVDLVCKIQPYVNNLMVVPNLFGMPMTNMEVEPFINQKAVILKVRNNLARCYNHYIKRGFDLTASIIGGLAISPILIIIAILIYVDCPGPIIFAHKRIGSNGTTFPCYKFRSMIVNAQEVLEKYLAENPAAREEWEKDFKLKDDPRITKIGHLLRKTSLDELPQLLNVIKGEMSLVGPRPIVDKEIAKYGTCINDYYMVKPGMTGYWQVSGRNDIDYDTRVQMDSWYVRNWSLWQDIVLLFKTVGVVFGKKGAY